MRGHYIRSRMQNIEEGESPSSYFCSLETRNFVNKTIPKVTTNNGITLTEQKDILNETKNFYKDLYTKKATLANINLKEKLPHHDIPKLNDILKLTLEGEITLNELTAALKRSKNGKSLGSDGYTVEFFKFFWNDIGKFVLRSINYAYLTGEMSVSQKLGVITCIPKPDKPKQYLKNWRPITLLNTTYKLASSCIAERIKLVLPKIINSDQTGFIPGRYIGENTRLIYDIMLYTEENDIPGILLLIDFEKAFDSVSWNFIDNVLDFFNFGNSIKTWVKTFYKNIKSTVTQNCILSDFFDVERGCRQGDPLSPYIFLLCAEILGILTRKNPEIKGITVDDTEFLISQYADDTSLILDGSSVSLDASLRTLQFFAEISGLHINIEKTKVIWIGKKRFSQEKICDKWGLEWGSNRFKLLGINFSVDLSEIEKMNYQPKLKEIENTIKIWTNQILSPIGKITVVKSLIISKLNHLFLTIPSPSKVILQQFISNLYSFIWDNKPDKVKRDVISQAYELGGLKMINVELYIKGLKLTWLRRIYKNNFKITKILESSENLNLQNLAYSGPSKQLKNPFWREVFDAWSDLILRFKVDCYNFTTCNIWNNENIKIGNKTVHYKEWSVRNVEIINDLIDENNTFMSFQKFTNIYKVKTNFLTYQGIISSIKKYMSSLGIHDFKKQQSPLIPNILKPLLKSDKGSRDMYIILNSQHQNPNCENQWAKIIDPNLDWKNIHMMSFKNTKNSKLQWFQYRIVHRILGTNKILHKMGKSESDKCTFCKESVETIEHIFWSCHKVAAIWEELYQWVNQTTNQELPLNLKIVIFGQLVKSEKTI